MTKLCHLVVFLLSINKFTISYYRGYNTCPDGQRVLYQGISNQDRNLVIILHNHFRNLLMLDRVPNQPRAMRLKTIEWDSQLEQAAAEAANQCSLHITTPEDPRWSWVGQNIHVSYTDKEIAADWQSALNSWFNQHKSFKYPSLDKTDKETLNYQQLVWESSERVGCTVIMYESPKQSGNNKFPVNNLYICLYGPGGNIIGQPPYRTEGGGNIGDEEPNRRFFKISYSHKTDADKPQSQQPGPYQPPYQQPYQQPQYPPAYPQQPYPPPPPPSPYPQQPYQPYPPPPQSSPYQPPYQQQQQQYPQQQQQYPQQQQQYPQQQQQQYPPQQQQQYPRPPRGFLKRRSLANLTGPSFDMHSQNKVVGPPSKQLP